MTPPDSPSATSRTACGACPGPHSRREFLGGVGAVLALLVVDGLLPADADALPVREVIGVASTASPGHELSYAVPESDGVSIDKKEGVIIARHAGTIYAFVLSCPHQNTALRWNDGNGTFQCPRYTSRYRADGTFIAGRATRAMDRFAVRREGELLLVDLDRVFEQDRDPTGWAGAKAAV